MRAGRGRTHRPSRGDSAAAGLQSDHQVRSPINRPEWNTIPSQVMWVPSGLSSFPPAVVNTIWAFRRTRPYRLATEPRCRYRPRLTSAFLVPLQHSKSGAMWTNLPKCIYFYETSSNVFGRPLQVQFLQILGIIWLRTENRVRRRWRRRYN